MFIQHHRLSSVLLNVVRVNSLGRTRFFAGSVDYRRHASSQSDEFLSSSKKKYTKQPPIDLKSVRTRQQVEEKDRPSDSSSSSSRLVALALLSIPLFTFGLGVWQVYRREAKLALLKFLEERTHSPPVELPTDPHELANLVATSEYAPFKLTGYFLHSKEILIAPRHDLTQSTHLPGALVVTPFVVKNRQPELIVLVNRGFVPYTNYSPVSRPNGQVDGECQIVGLLRSNEVTNSFTPDNKPPSEWHYRDVDSMAKTLGTAPIFLDAVEETTIRGGPVAGQTAINLRNEHMSYIITWFTLSALTTFLWWRRFGKVVF